MAQGAYMDVEIGTLDGHLMAYIADGGDSENIGDSGYSPGEILALDLLRPPMASTRCTTCTPMAGRSP